MIGGLIIEGERRNLNGASKTNPTLVKIISRVVKAGKEAV